MSHIDSVTKTDVQISANRSEGRAKKIAFRSVKDSLAMVHEERLGLKLGYGFN